MDANIESLIYQCAQNVQFSTMAAIIKVESAGNPWRIGNNTLHIEHKPTPRNKEEAVAIAKRYLAMGHSIDMGLTQLNSNNLISVGMTVDEVFEPCNNIKAGAKIISAFYTQSSKQYGQGRTALIHALSAYNTGSLFAGGQYVQRILRAATNDPKLDTSPILKEAKLEVRTLRSSIPQKVSSNGILINNDSSMLILK